MPSRRAAAAARAAAVVRISNGTAAAAAPLPPAAALAPDFAPAADFAAAPDFAPAPDFAAAPLPGDPPWPLATSGLVPDDPLLRTDLEAEVEDYAIRYPRRVQAIRRHGGLPPDCAFGPPDGALLAALLRSRNPAVLAIDAAAPA